MKKTLLLILATLLAVFSLNAQQYDVLEQVRQDPRKSYGMEGPHRFDSPAQLTKAPSGYKPFYIGHYGRHGSRYAWNSKTYTLIQEVLEKADKKGVLTPYGKTFREKYEAFYMEPWINAGDLVPLGFEQHQRIGEFVYKSFPQVFKGAAQVKAISSTAQRCIVSMGAFNLGLKSGNPKLRITLGSTHDGMCIVAPPSAPKTLRRSFVGEKDHVDLESSEHFAERIFPADEILGKLFTSTAFLDSFEGGKWKFLDELWELCCGYHNYVTEPLFDDLFTDDERVLAWEASNYYSCRGDLTSRYAMIPLLEDFIAKGNAAIAGEGPAANLRFGHDYILEGFVTLLNVNKCGTLPATPEEAKYWFQSYNIPMAGTILFVLYKNKKGDVLFKVLLNEQEATLPELTPVSGPYYRWSDFLTWTDALLKEHPEVK